MANYLRIVLVSVVAALGCSKAPEPVADPEPHTAIQEHELIMGIMLNDQYIRHDDIRWKIQAEQVSDVKVLQLDALEKPDSYCATVSFKCTNNGAGTILNSEEIGTDDGGTAPIIGPGSGIKAKVKVTYTVREGGDDLWSFTTSSLETLSAEQLTDL